MLILCWLLSGLGNEPSVDSVYSWSKARKPSGLGENELATRRRWGAAPGPVCGQHAATHRAHRPHVPSQPPNLLPLPSKGKPKGIQAPPAGWAPQCPSSQTEPPGLAPAPVEGRVTQASSIKHVSAAWGHVYASTVHTYPNRKLTVGQSLHAGCCAAAQPRPCSHLPLAARVGPPEPAVLCRNAQVLLRMPGCMGGTGALDTAGWRSTAQRL